MCEVFFTSFNAKAFSPLPNVSSFEYSWEVRIASCLFKQSSHVSLCLGLGDVNMRTMSKNGRMSHNSHHHDEGAKGIDLWGRIEQFNRVARSRPNSIH